MMSIVIPDIDDELKRRLTDRAVAKGHSIEVEAREILEDVLTDKRIEAVPDNLFGAIRRIVDPLGGLELQLFPRQPSREPPDLG